MDLESAQIGPYAIDREIGRGGMGVVYQGRDTRLDRDVAIKALPESLLEDPERLGRFEREAKTLALLNHPNIAGIYGVEEHEGRRYLVLECVAGETLAERLDRGPLPVDVALEVCSQIAAGVEAAHEAGVIHRDLKPANVKIAPDGAVKVLDFGLAKAQEATGLSGSGSSESPTLTTPQPQHSPTMPGAILGTAAYMSPEQARGRPIDRRTDVWSFGVILYECLTGASPFAGETATDSIGAILHKPPDFDKLPSDTPALVRHVLERCLERDKTRRYRDIGDVRVELEAARREESGWGEGVGATRAAPAASRARRWAPWTLVVIFGAVAVLAATSWWRAASRDASLVRANLALPTGLRLHLPGASPGAPALSPDGRHVVYAARDGDGNVSLWLRSLDQAAARELPGTDGAQYPFWSPDSRSVAFFARGKLHRVAIFGGSPIALTDAGNGKGGDWSQDGVIIFSAAAGSPIFRVSASGGEAAPVTQLDPEAGENSHRLPCFLPDGEHFLYVARVAGSDAGGNIIRVGSLSSGDVAEVLRSDTQARYVDGHLLYMLGSSLMVQRFNRSTFQLEGDPISLVDPVHLIGGAELGLFSASDTGTLLYLPGGVEQADTELVWRDRAGERLGAVPQPGVVFDFALFNDGASLASQAYDPQTGAPDIWLYDLERGMSTRFTADPGAEDAPTPSPGGDRIAFTATRDGAERLYVKTVGGFREARPLGGPMPTFTPSDWTPDGRFIVGFDSAPGAGSGLRRVPVEDPSASELFLATDATEGIPDLSPDGKWIAFSSNASGAYEVYVTSYPEVGRLHRVSSAGGAYARWRGDGGELFYQGADGVIYAVEVVAGEDTLATGPPQPLFDTRRPLESSPIFDVTPDGEQFLVNEPAADQAVEPLVLVLGWRALLNR